MIKNNGIRLAICYFIENHLFDLINKTDTHKLVPLKELQTKSKFYKHSVLYMSSWTSTIIKSTKIAMKLSKYNYEDTNFIDIGSGKGKVLLVWAKIFSIKLSIYGFEINKMLHNICKNNLKIINNKNVTIFNHSATLINKKKFSKGNNIIYLYNPFDKIILKEFLTSIIFLKNVYIIYNNPVHADLFSKFNFELTCVEKSWHPNKSFNIYKKI